MYSISQSVVVHAPLEKVYQLVADTEKRLRLHPSWEVLRFKKLGDRKFRVRVKKESGEVREYVLVITELLRDRITCREEKGDFDVEIVLEEVEGGVRLTHTERFSLPWEASEKTLKSMEDELKYWLEAIRHYCELQDNPLARTSRFIIDHFLLKLPPQQRRIVMLIIILNAGILFLFILMFAGMKVASMIL
ncbi:SRPBCC family protein [Candidatus Pyrohabitans sp.]